MYEFKLALHLVNITLELKRISKLRKFVNAEIILKIMQDI